MIKEIGIKIVTIPAPDYYLEIIICLIILLIVKRFLKKG